MSRVPIKSLAVAAWVLAILAGLAGIGLRLATGHELAGYGSYVPWGLWIALYAWFVGLSAGAFLLFAAGEVFRIERLRRLGRPALVVALASLLSGLVLVGLDLGHLWRFWHVYAFGNPRSLMAWEISFYTAFGALLTATVVVAFRNDIAALAGRGGIVGRAARTLRLRRLRGRPPEESGWLRALALVGGILTVTVAGATGALFGVVGAQAYWHTGLLPLLFIAAALLSGAAVLTVVAALARGRGDAGATSGDVSFLGRLTLVLLGVVLLMEWADVSVAFYSRNLVAWDSYELILTGSYWWVFWLVHLLAGVAVPAALLLWRPRSVGVVATAAGLVAVTLVAVRLNVVIPGLTVPQIEGLDRAFQEEGLSLTYFPTLVEWLVAIFGGALLVGLVAAWHLLVPIRFATRPAPAVGVRAAAAAGPATTRGDFLGKAGLVGGAVVAAQAPLALHFLNDPGDATAAPMGSSPYELARAENVLYSVCQQCNTQCGIKAKIQDGVVVKIDGNPYSPWTLHPPLPYETPLTQAAAVEGGLCPKGQAGLQSAYDPYRIRQVLKRVGPRGSGRWETVPFERAVAEIVEGGDLFGEGPVTGLRELWALRDPDLAKEMAADVDAIWHGEMTVEEFNAKHADHLDLLIDPDHPDLGPKNNQVVYAWGRLKGGRSELYKRFFSDSFGSTNGHGHTTVCQGSLYFSGKAMSEQVVEGSWQGGAKFYWQADVAGSEFVIFVGASPFEANYGPPWRTSGITDGLASGRLKIAVVDPRLSKTAAKAWKWLPIRPGTEGALALAMIRWIIDEGRYDATFLGSANTAAAAAAGETTWTNASWLVKVEDGVPTTFLRASEIGLAEVETRSTDDEEPVSYEFDYFVALADSRPTLVDPGDEETPAVGDLLVDTFLGGFRVKSALRVLHDAASEHTLEEWAEICGLDADDVVELAREFTSHGKKAAADIHRGVSQHTNGYSNVIAWYSLNALVGNYDWKGGLAKATTYDVIGDKDGEPIAGKPFVLKDLHSSKLKPFGISSIRHGIAYEKTTIFADYPARRPWYYLASDVYQEIVPSIGDAYPYPVKALFLYMGTPVYALPGGHTNIEILSDPKKLPLFVASDITIGETSMYADYIFPDLTYLERWEFAGSHPSVTYKVQPVRQPVIAPRTDTVTVFGEEMPLSFETMLLGLAEKLELPGFGPDGLGEGRPLTRAEDFYLLMAANVAAGDKEDPVPEASPDEIDLFLRAREHLPATVFDPGRWSAAVGPDWWSRVVYVLNRGGRFADTGYDEERLKNPYGKQLNLYQEKTAKAVNAMTGEHYPGVARYVPAPQSSVGEPVDDGDAFPLRMITFREIMHTKSRTPGNYWLLALLPENAVILNRATARELGLADDDWVRIVSATNPEGTWPLGNGKVKPMVGKVRTIEGIRPGVVAFSLGHGHWAYGAGDVEVDGRVIAADPRRGRGIHANAAMRLDPHLGNTCLSDLAGGSAVFYDTSVRLERASEDDAGVIAA
jgi:tetrathionate reductase subunit A